MFAQINELIKVIDDAVGSAIDLPHHGNRYLINSQAWRSSGPASRKSFQIYVSG